MTQLLDVGRIRRDFPILSREVRAGVPLVYLDSAATSQKPTTVLQGMETFYREQNANVHRAVYALAVKATEVYEDARKKVAGFFGAAHPQEIIFTRNTTEAINLVARTWARINLAEGDRILLTELEHHSNIVPWHMLAREKKLILEYVPVLESGLLDMEQLETLVRKSPKLVAVTHMSNVFGTILPVADIIRLAHQNGAIVLIDGAQSIAHLPVNVRELDADFYAISAHKMCGPTGIGALYGKRKLLQDMPPFLGGGDMIRSVSWTDFQPNDVPYAFEAGTQPIAEAVGFGAAVDYLQSIGMPNIHRHEQVLTEYALEKFQEIEGVRVLGPAAEHKGGVVAFTVKGIHPHDVAQILDSMGIAVRAGHHCAMPLHRKFGLEATTRASFYLYTMQQEIEKLIEGIRKAQRIFAEK